MIPRERGSGILPDRQFDAALSDQLPESTGTGWKPVPLCESKLGTARRFPYRETVIGFLRFIGVSNAAIWLGGVFFCTFEIRSALFSPEMETLLGNGNSTFFPYLSGAIAQIVWMRCFEFQIVCAGIAWLHALAEWLYLGRPSRRFSFGVLAGLLALAVFGAAWVQPRLKEVQRAARHPAVVHAPEHDSAVRSYPTWQTLSAALNVVVIGGLLVYIWRVANPPDTARFVSSVKFRG